MVKELQKFKINYCKKHLWRIVNEKKMKEEIENIRRKQMLCLRMVENRLEHCNRCGLKF